MWFNFFKIANGKQIQIQNEVITACMKTLFQNSPGYTGEKSPKQS